MPTTTLHPFTQACCRAHIRHSLTKVSHLWTKGLVDRVGGTINAKRVYRWYFSSVGLLMAMLSGVERHVNEHQPYNVLGGQTQRY